MQATINIRTILPSGREFPEELRAIPGAPHSLQIAGSLPPVAPVAIVGSRKVSPYGKRITAWLASRLARRGVPVVSGLAFGVDITAHLSVLGAGGLTAAVLPSGLDARSITPQSHAPVARRIVASGGALVSEYASGTPARKEHYDDRNRLVSGMARAVVVVEAAPRSGSMLTARHAAEQGRDTWAVPGPIDSEVSRGTNQLIADGAMPLRDIDEFITSLGLNDVAMAPSSGVLRLFSSVPRHVDEVWPNAAMSPAELDQAITRLELQGALQHVGGRYYTTT